MPAKVILSRLAEEDLVSIWEFIATGSVQAADRFLDRLRDTVHMLSRFPEMGRAREELAHGVRSFPFGDYLILYLPRPRGIAVVRVVSGFRSLQGLFE